MEKCALAFSALTKPTRTVKWEDLEENHPYDLIRLCVVKETKFGEAYVAVFKMDDDTYQIYLPQRYQNIKHLFKSVNEALDLGKNQWTLTWLGSTGGKNASNIVEIQPKSN